MPFARKQGPPGGRPNGWRFGVFRLKGLGAFLFSTWDFPGASVEPGSVCGAPSSPRSPSFLVSDWLKI